MDGPTDGWLVFLDSPLPARLAAGAESAVALAGWVFHPSSATVSVTIACGDGPEVPVDAHSMGRPDVRNALAPAGRAARRRAQASGFWGLLPLPAVRAETTVPIRLRARATNGATLEEQLGELTLVPAEPPPGGGAGPVDDAALVICLATHEPDPELLAAQIDSIRAQSYPDWHCLVVDDASSDAGRARLRATLAGDPRFTLVEHRRNLGFYGNFERALLRVPPTARYVALSDQDDLWFPDKLERLVAALEADGAQLAYGDMHVVERDGRLRQRSFWTSRPNNHRDLAALLSANTVTGAACVFRRELLDRALPLPPRWRHAYHDHWLALVALTTGTIAFVDAPLQAYVQHDQQVIGHVDGPVERRSRWQRVPLAPAWLRHHRLSVAMGGGDYTGHTLYRRWLGTILLARVGTVATPRARGILRRAADGDRGVRGLVLAVVRAVAGRGPRRSTVGHHAAELRGALWRRRNRCQARTSLLPAGALEPAARHFDDLVRYLPDERD